MTATMGRGGHRRARRARVWACWARSSRDGQVHAFPLVEGPVDRDREAMCFHTAAPTQLDSRADGPRCPLCARGSRTPP